MNHQDTICAIATAQGGAIGIVRVSGPDAVTLTDRIFTPIGSTVPLTERKPYTLAFGHIKKCWSLSSVPPIPIRAKMPPKFRAMARRISSSK